MSSDGCAAADLVRHAAPPRLRARDLLLLLLPCVPLVQVAVLRRHSSAQSAAVGAAREPAGAGRDCADSRHAWCCDVNRSAGCRQRAGD